MTTYPVRTDFYLNELKKRRKRLHKKIERILADELMPTVALACELSKAAQTKVYARNFLFQTPSSHEDLPAAANAELNELLTLLRFFYMETRDATTAVDFATEALRAKREAAAEEDAGSTQEDETEID